MANNELSKAEWLSKAEAYCARSEHCAADVRRKFIEWQTPADLFDEIEEILYTKGFLDDARFCHAYVHDKVAYSSTISEALNEIDETTYMDNLRQLVQSRRKDSPEKRLRFLLQRGFTYEEIKKCK